MPDPIPVETPVTTVYLLSISALAFQHFASLAGPESAQEEIRTFLVIPRESGNS
jgi:hypothetical protein